MENELIEELHQADFVLVDGKRLDRVFLNPDEPSFSGIHKGEHVYIEFYLNAEGLQNAQLNKDDVWETACGKIECFIKVPIR